MVAKHSMTIDLQTIVLGALGLMVSIALTIIGFLARASWNQLHKQLDDIDSEMHRRLDEIKKFTGSAIDDLYKSKADSSELGRALDQQSAIIERVEKHSSEDRASHGQIMQSIGRLEGKMDSILVRKRGDDR